MSDVFISYSRIDGDFAREVHDYLANKGNDVWIDWEDIPPTADWWQEIQSAIEEAHIFVFVISPNSVRSDVCRDEIQYAIDNNKRFIPIMYQELEDVDAPNVHPAIRSHNWIPFADESQYEASFQKLLGALSTEPEYLRRHTRLLVRGKEWLDNQRQASYLLKGAELREFQQWLHASQTLEPKPTELQYDYILASQTAQTRNQLRIAGAIMGAIVLVAILGIFSFLQQQQIAQQNDEGTIVAQEQAILEATALAQGTQIAAQGTRIAAVQNNATSIIQEANIQNTQSALQFQITALQQTIEFFEADNAVTSTSNPTETATSTLPPTWTATVEVVDDDSEASAAGISSATNDPEIMASATAQVILYATTTEVARVSPTMRPSPERRPTQLPPPTMAAAPPPQTITYVVQDGDFAVDIAARFDVSVEDIMNVNGLGNASLIFVGQQLLIPYQLDIETDEALHVAPTGENTPDCGANDMPCLTIAHALSLATGLAEIHLAPGVYTQNIIIDRDVVIVGDGIETTILTGNFDGTIIMVNPDVSVSMIGMTITGGVADWGGGIVNYGEISLQNVKVSGNVANLTGGGIANFGTLTANYVDFEDNYAPYFADIYSAPNAGILANDTMNFSLELALPDSGQTEGDLAVGVLVQVTTTDGDILNFRPAPNINATPALPLEAGTPLLIIGEPERNNGFQWWRVQRVGGNIGWVADFDEEITIMPIESP